MRASKFIENNPREAAILGEDYTGSSSTVFEKILTSIVDWISYNNMVANEVDMTGMAEKLVAMGLWSKVPEDILSHYFDMRFVKKAELTIRSKYLLHAI